MPKSRRPSKPSSSGKKVLGGDFSGGKRPKVIKEKPVRPRSFRDLQIDRIISGEG